MLVSSENVVANGPWFLKLAAWAAFSFYGKMGPGNIPASDE
jgi:hypothetical protein